MNHPPYGGQRLFWAVRWDSGAGTEPVVEDAYAYANTTEPV
jgi:hypothetical protein